MSWSICNDIFDLTLLEVVGLSLWKSDDSFYHRYVHELLTAWRHHDTPCKSFLVFFWLTLKTEKLLAINMLNTISILKCISSFVILINQFHTWSRIYYYISYEHVVCDMQYIYIVFDIYVSLTCSFTMWP